MKQWEEYFERVEESSLTSKNVWLIEGPVQKMVLKGCYSQKG